MYNVTFTCHECGHEYETEDGVSECCVEEGGHEPHDLQCMTCGVTLNNQCLDPDCTEDDDHESDDVECQECAGEDQGKEE